MKYEMLNKMISLATAYHHGQYDRAGLPYILHPLEVMRILNTSDEELMCIAIGHDLLEDTPLTLMDLDHEGFSLRVTEGIYHLTKQLSESYEEYISRLIKNSDAIKVKLADLTHNMDVKRLKILSEDDILRLKKYQYFYHYLRGLDGN